MKDKIFELKEKSISLIYEIDKVKKQRFFIWNRAVFLKKTSSTKVRKQMQKTSLLLDKLEIELATVTEKINKLKVNNNETTNTTIKD